jgi:arsenate reductase (thioredoxin)
VKVIFACIHNAGRSQMAAAFYNLMTGGGALSAGTDPAQGVHPEVAEVMKEEGVDLSAVRPQLLTPELAQKADLLITMCCGESCPYVPGVSREDWPFADPKGKSLEEVRQIRDQIKRRVEALINEHQ